MRGSALLSISVLLLAGCGGDPADEPAEETSGPLVSSVFQRPAESLPQPSNAVHARGTHASDALAGCPPNVRCAPMEREVIPVPGGGHATP